MELKDLLKEQLKTKTKLKLMEELEISYRTLQRAIEGETIRKDIYDRIMDRLDKYKKKSTFEEYLKNKIDSLENTVEHDKDEVVKVTPMEDE